MEAVQILSGMDRSSTGAINVLQWILVELLHRHVVVKCNQYGIMDAVPLGVFEAIP